MKKQIILIGLATAVCATGTAAAYGQFGGLGKAIKRKAKKEAIKKADEEIENAIRGKGKKGKKGSKSSSKSSGPLGKPSANLTKFTKCAGFNLTNVTIGKLGGYTFQQGFSKEKRTGFINRKPASVDGCVLSTGLQADEVLYFEVDYAKYKKTKSGQDWILQCVDSNNPGGGTVSLESTNGTADTYLGASHMKLHCGNDQGQSYCASGTNSSRAGSYSADMKKKGKYGASFLARAANKLERGETQRLYCQYYNKPTGKSLVAFEMIANSPYD